MDVTEYAACDSVRLAELIRQGEVSEEEVQEAARQAIDKVNPRLNAVADGPWQRPLEYAADGPFRGVPFVIKDLVCHAAGVPTRAGTRLTGQRGVVFDYDTHLMSRFRAAGLATLAVTTTPELGFNANTEALVYGSTRNPWDTDLSAGGSSGGTGALVAAGAVSVGHANDGGGSIRIPASFNGLVGLKPSRGRTPIGPDYAEALSGLAIEFVLVRSVRDCAALLDAVAGPMPGDKFVIEPPQRPYAAEVGADPGRLRVAVQVESWSGSPVDTQVAAAVQHVGEQLESLGHSVENAAPAFDWDEFITANVPVWCEFLAESVAALTMMSGHTPSRDLMEATTYACTEHGNRVTALEMAAAGATFNRVSRLLGDFFTQHDLLVTPTVNLPAQPLGFLDANDTALDAEGWTRKIFHYCSFTPLFNVTGTPTLSLPLGWTDAGLPIGVQLAARMGDEATLFRIAAQLEQALPWARHVPAVHASK
jgi:amidase